MKKLDKLQKIQAFGKFAAKFIKFIERFRDYISNLEDEWFSRMT